MKQQMQHGGLKLLLTSAMYLAAATPAPAETIDAQWQVYQIRFNYIAQGTHYTCDGMERTLRRLLLLLGARDDARVESDCSDNYNLRSTNVRRLQRVQRVKLAFAMPVPADKSDISREIIPAEWQQTRVTGRLSRYLDAADCELLAQFQRQVVPRLLVRSERDNLFCDHGSRQFNELQNTRALRLRMTVLREVKAAQLED